MTALSLSLPFQSTSSSAIENRKIPFSSNFHVWLTLFGYNYSLLPGYRHVRLRNASNQPLELATLFIYSKHEEESLDMCSAEEHTDTIDSSTVSKRRSFAKIKDSSESGKDVSV